MVEKNIAKCFFLEKVLTAKNECDRVGEEREVSEMRNIYRIKHIGVRQLAEMLVHEQSEPDYDYNYEEELEYVGDITWYVSPDGMKAYSLEDAIEHTIEWLESEEELEVV